MCLKKLRTRLRMEALDDRVCPSSTVVLPISAFTSVQGTSMLFTPPVPDQIGWVNSEFDPGATPTDPNRFLMVDYTGQAATYLLSNGINLNTQITGFVTETTIGNGMMEVSVNLQATNALTWVANIDGLDVSLPGVANIAPLELGYRAQDLVANPSLTPALSNVHFQFTFQEEVGEPLPDLVQSFFFGNAPAGFAPEVLDFQSWGSGTLRADTTVGTPGQRAFVNTSQVGDFVNLLPGTLPDGFIQEPINIVPIGAGSKSVAYLNGSLFITDLGNGHDHISVAPTATGGAIVSGNVGKGTYSDVTSVYVSLGNGNSHVLVGNLPNARVNVAALDGNNRILIGNESQVVVNVGGGNNVISVGNASPALVFVGGHGNNFVNFGSGQNNLYLAGNGNNRVIAAGTGDFLHLFGNGSNFVIDVGTNDSIYLAGDGHNTIINLGSGSFTYLQGSTGKNNVLGSFSP